MQRYRDNAAAIRRLFRSGRLGLVRASTREGGSLVVAGQPGIGVGDGRASGHLSSGAVPRLIRASGNLILWLLPIP